MKNAPAASHEKLMNYLRENINSARHSGAFKLMHARSLWWFSDDQLHDMASEIQAIFRSRIRIKLENRRGKRGAA